MASSSQAADDQYHFKYGSVPKLTFTNYHLWQPDMENFLRVIDSLEIVRGNETLPADDQAATTLFKSRSAKAIAMIYNSCSPAVKSLIRGIDDPAVMWGRLGKTLCMANTPFGSMVIRRKPNFLEPTSDDIIGYLSEVMVCRDQLAGSSQPITDGEVIAKLTSAVPGFSIYLRQIMLCDPSHVKTLDFVIRSLLEFDQDAKQKRLSDGDLDSTKAAVASTPPSQASSRAGRRPSRGNTRGPSPCNSSLYSGVRKPNYRGNRNRGL